MRRPCRQSLATAAVLGITLIPACSSGIAGGPAPVANPATAAEATARLLAPAKMTGFWVTRVDVPYRPVKAQPFVPPRGSLSRVCTTFSTPPYFIPSTSASAGEAFFLPRQEQRRYRPFPPWWSEWIYAYPGTEAAGIVTALPGLIGKCGHFVFANGGISPVTIPAHESVAPLPGFGDQALYVSVRLPAGLPGRFWADDWVVIRSDRTLIFIEGKYVGPVGSAHDTTTLQLAKEAWHRYSAA